MALSKCSRCGDRPQGLQDFPDRRVMQIACAGCSRRVSIMYRPHEAKSKATDAITRLWEWVQ